MQLYFFPSLPISTQGNRELAWRIRYFQSPSTILNTYNICIAYNRDYRRAVGWKRKSMTPCIKVGLFVKSKTKQKPNGIYECQHFLLHKCSYVGRAQAPMDVAKQQTWRAAGVFRNPWTDLCGSPQKSKYSPLHSPATPNNNRVSHWLLFQEAKITCEVSLKGLNTRNNQRAIVPLITK